MFRVKRKGKKINNYQMEKYPFISLATNIALIAANFLIFHQLSRIIIIKQFYNKVAHCWGCDSNGTLDIVKADLA